MYNNLLSAFILMLLAVVSDASIFIGVRMELGLHVTVVQAW
jgi:hypothetical protein